MFRRDKNREAEKDLITSSGRVMTMVIFTGAWATVAVFVSGHPKSGLSPSAKKLVMASIVLAPVLSFFIFEFFNTLLDIGLKGAFGRKGGTTAPAHSEGEALMQREQYVEAADWFSEKVILDPSDWKAQARLVEIINRYLDDPDREASERSHLLKMEGVPEGLWIESAFDLGEYWERMNRPDRAISAYKGLIWKFPEGSESDEARRRIKTLETPGDDTGS